MVIKPLLYLLHCSKHLLKYLFLYMQFSSKRTYLHCTKTFTKAGNFVCFLHPIEQYLDVLTEWMNSVNSTYSYIRMWRSFYKTIWHLILAHEPSCLELWNRKTWDRPHLVSLGCYNKILLMEWFINNRKILLIVLESGELKIRVPAWLGSGEGLFLTCRSGLLLFHGRRDKEFFEVATRVLISLMRIPPLWRPPPPNAPPCNTLQLEF